MAHHSEATSTANCFGEGIGPLYGGRSLDPLGQGSACQNGCAETTNYDAPKSFSTRSPFEKCIILARTLSIQFIVLFIFSTQLIGAAKIANPS